MHIMEHNIYIRYMLEAMEVFELDGRRKCLLMKSPIPMLDVLQLRPSSQKFPIPILSTLGRQVPDENL